jgi:putative SOS response-associated peptidase YedK
MNKNKHKFVLLPGGATERDREAMWRLSRDEVATIWFALQSHMEEHIKAGQNQELAYEDRATCLAVATAAANLMSQVFECHATFAERDAARRWLDVE